MLASSCFGPGILDMKFRYVFAAAAVLFIVGAMVYVSGGVSRRGGENPGRSRQGRSVVVTSEKSGSGSRRVGSNVALSSSSPGQEAVAGPDAEKAGSGLADAVDEATTNSGADAISIAEPNPVREMGNQLREHPGDISKLLEQLKTETDPEKIALLAQLIAENANEAGVDLPVKELMGMLSDPLAAKRDAALAILSQVEDVTPEMIKGVGDIARTDVETQVRMSAITTMGRWLNGDSMHRDALSQQLIQTRDASRDNAVRGYAIQAIGLQKHGLPANMIEPISQSVYQESSPDNRSIAALALSNVDEANRASAVRTLEQAFATETNLDTKRHLVTMLMRTAGTEAPAVLGRLDTNHDLVRQDVADYLEIIARGETNVDRIFELKEARDGERGSEPSKDPD